MSDLDIDVKQIEKKVHDLAEAMDRVRNDQASRDDVVVDMRQASRTRLEMLARELQPVFAEIPDENDQFEFALTNGEPPRLWIDMTSFVRMGRDRRLYEFVKDTRRGRTILGHSEDRTEMARMVTSYVAERMLERERRIEGDWVAMRRYDFAKEEAQATQKTPSPGSRDWYYLLWFVMGLAAGIAGLAFLWLYGDLAQFLPKP